MARKFFWRGDQDGFEGEDALVVFFEFSAALGCSDFDPVGGTVAGAGEPLARRRGGHGGAAPRSG